MKIRLICCSISLLLVCTTGLFCGAQSQPAKNPAVHPMVGCTASAEGVTITLKAKIQNFNPSHRDHDASICSPKSVTIYSDSSRFYINSLEGCQTVVYSLDNLNKLGVVSHRFTKSDSLLWAPSSGFFKFSDKFENPDCFSGKPVESVLTHGGRYLWTTYYRRSFDTNACNPSALLCVDTRTNTRVRVFETGVLPKMVAASPDGHYLAVSHWGDNTVALMDISSAHPQDWKFVKLFVVEYRLNLDFDKNTTVNRDKGSGYALRGTVFTNDGKYLLVACMGGDGGIAVIDLATMSYRGRIMGSMNNVRHLLINNGYLYLSANIPGYVQRIPVDVLEQEIEKLPAQSSKSIVTVRGWESCQVYKGTRTICVTPDGKYLFAACNSGSCIAVVRTSDFKMITSIPADSFPVGMAVSADGSTLITTSQAANGIGGNAVDIYSIDYRK